MKLIVVCIGILALFCSIKFCNIQERKRDEYNAKRSKELFENKVKQHGWYVDKVAGDVYNSDGMIYGHLTLVSKEPTAEERKQSEREEDNKQLQEIYAFMKRWDGKKAPPAEQQWFLATVKGLTSRGVVIKGLKGGKSKGEEGVE